MSMLEPPEPQKPDRPPNEFDVRIRRLDALREAGYPRFGALVDLAQTRFGLAIVGTISTAMTLAVALIKLT